MRHNNQHREMLHQSRLPHLHYPWTRISKRRCGLSLEEKSFLRAQHFFHFDILAQLANSSARITLHELLFAFQRKQERRLGICLQTRSFLVQVPSIPIDERGTLCPHCHLASQQVPSITFTLEDMLLKDN